MIKIADKHNASYWTGRLYKLAARHDISYHELKSWIFSRYHVISSGQLYLSQYYELKEILKALPLKRIKNETPEQYQRRKLSESGLSLTNSHRSVPVSQPVSETQRNKWIRSFAVVIGHRSIVRQRLPPWRPATSIFPKGTKTMRCQKSFTGRAGFDSGNRKLCCVEIERPKSSLHLLLFSKEISRAKK